jgi:CBS domain-containing protein
VVVADPSETVLEAARRMRTSHVGDLVVVDSQRRPIGLLTDRDIVVGAVAQSPERLSGLLVGDVMTREVVTVRGTEEFEEIIGIMRRHGMRRLPVVAHDGRLEGIITLDDVLRRIATEVGQLVGLIALEQQREREVRAG